MTKTTKLILIVLLPFTTLLSACTTNTTQQNPTTYIQQEKQVQTLSQASTNPKNQNQQLVKPFTSLSPKQFNYLTKQSDIIIIDVRTPQEFAQGYISGAINIDIYNPNFAKEIAKLDKNKHYLIYCRSWNRSKAAMKLMKQLGFKKVNDLEWWINNWIKIGFPIIK